MQLEPSAPPISPDEKLAPEDNRAFSPWRRTRENTAARRLSEAVAQRITDHERRTRQRRPKDAAIFSALVDTVVANLLLVQLSTDATPDEENRGRLYISLSGQRLKSASQTRYDRTHIPLGTLRTRLEKNREARPGVLDCMADLDLIYLDKAPRHPDAARPSTIKCSDGMLELIAEHDPRLDELQMLFRAVSFDGEIIERELIELRDAKQAGHARGQPIEYRDADETRECRKSLQMINEALDRSDITFDLGNGVINGRRVPNVGAAIYERTLRRVHHNGRWEHGGRLYGAFWITMQKELRDGIRIDGHRVVSLDFSSMYLQLLYVTYAKKPVPDGDLYEGIDPVDGWPEADPERKKAMRDTIKANVNAMLFPKPGREGKPYGRLLDGSRSVLSKSVTGPTLEKRLKEKHPAIAKWIGAKDVGFELMHHESEIMIKTVLRCLEQDIVVLPLHDGLLVAAPHKEIARQAMLEAFAKHTDGFVARVS